MGGVGDGGTGVEAVSVTFAQADSISRSIAELRKLHFCNPADERARLEIIERLTRSLDGLQFEFQDNRPIRQGKLI